MLDQNAIETELRKELRGISRELARVQDRLAPYRARRREVQMRIWNYCFSGNENTRELSSFRSMGAENIAALDEMNAWYREHAAPIEDALRVLKEGKRLAEINLLAATEKGRNRVDPTLVREAVAEARRLAYGGVAQVAHPQVLQGVAGYANEQKSCNTSPSAVPPIGRGPAQVSQTPAPTAELSGRKSRPAALGGFATGTGPRGSSQGNSRRAGRVRRNLERMAISPATCVVCGGTDATVWLEEPTGEAWHTTCWAVEFPRGQSAKKQLYV